MRPMTCAAAAVLVVMAVGCSPRDRRDTASTVDSVAPDIPEAARDAGQEVREDVGGDYTYDRRDDFRRDIGERVNQLDQEIAGLERTTKKNVDQARDTALVHIRSARRAVARELDRIAGATEATWDDVRSGINRSVDSLDLLVRARRPDAKPMGGTGPS